MVAPAARRDTASMARPIPVQLAPAPTVEPERQPSVEIDAMLVARGLGVDVVELRRLMDARKISVLCERGTGEDAGLFRASFYHEDKRVRLVVDAAGNPISAPDRAA